MLDGYSRNWRGRVAGVGGRGNYWARDICILVAFNMGYLFLFAFLFMGGICIAMYLFFIVRQTVHCKTNVVFL